MELKHLTHDELLALRFDELNPTDTLTLMEHISSCDFCANQFIHIMSEEMITAPKDLKRSILEEVKRPEIQITMKAKETSKKLQLLFYSIKVGGAMLGALIFLLFTIKMNSYNLIVDINPSQEARKEPKVKITTLLRDQSDHLNNYLLDLSNSILKMEGTVYDQKEK